MKLCSFLLYNFAIALTGMASNQTDVLSYLLQSFLLLLILPPNKRFLMDVNNKHQEIGFKSFSCTKHCCHREKNHNIFILGNPQCFVCFPPHLPSIPTETIKCFLSGPLASGFFFLHFYPLKKGILFCVVRDFFKALLNLQVILPRTFFFC